MKKVVMILELMILLLATSFVSNIVSAPPISGDWVVQGTESYADTTIYLNGSLIVTETGKLTLENVTLVVNSTYDGEHAIQVNQSGVLLMNNTLVKPYDTAFTYGFEVYGSLFLNNSTVEDPFGLPFSVGHRGGIQVFGGNLTMDHSKVTRSRANGVHLNNANATLSNCEISYSFVDELHVFQSDSVNVTSCNVTDTATWVGEGIWIGDSNNFSLENSNVSNHYGYGIFARWSPGLRVNNSVFSGTDPSGIEMRDSNDSVISNSTFVDNFSDGIYVQTSRGVVLDSNEVFSGAVGGGIGLLESEGTLYNNSLNDTGGFWVENSHADFIRNSLQNSIGIGFLSIHSNITLSGDALSDSLFLWNSTVEAFEIVTPSFDAESSSVYLENSTLLSPGPFDISWGSHAVLLNTSIISWESFSVDYPRWNASDPSELTIRNYLDIRTLDESDSPLQGSDILVKDDGTNVYASLAFGGTDPRSDVNGESNWIVVTDRVYRKDYQESGHPFENITYNVTSVFVSKSGYKFSDNPRIVEMNESHIETFKAVAPLPPFNITAELSGSNNQNVTVRWEASPDDGNQSHGVSNYHVFRGMKYDRSGVSYQWIAAVANTTTQFTDIGKGDGDSFDYFYVICASNPRNFSSCAQNQAGKFSRNLSAGIQIVSIPLIQQDWNISEVFRTVEYDKMWTYTNGDVDSWKSLSKEKIFNDFSALNHSMGIWVNVTLDDKLVVAGVIPNETTITIRPGWNLIGFPSFNETYSVQDLILETGAITIEGYDAFNPPYHLQKLLPSDILTAGEAYWVFTDTETLLTLSN